jgi:hypothetical protein
MQYPVFAYKTTEKGRFYAFSLQSKLERTSKRLLQQNIFSNVHFIDAQGDHYEVLSVKKIKWGTWLWGFSLIYKSRSIIVDFDLHYLSRESIESLKRIILIDQNGEQFLEEETTRKLMEAQSIIEIIALFY